MTLDQLSLFIECSFIVYSMRSLILFHEPYRLILLENAHEDELANLIMAMGSHTASCLLLDRDSLEFHVVPLAELLVLCAPGHLVKVC